MKKITLLLFAVFAFALQGNAQFSEDFEAGVPGLFTEVQDAGAVAWGSCGGSLGTQTCPITGTASASFYLASYTATVTSLTTPTLDLSAAGGFRLKFNHSQEAWGTDQNTLEVLISTDGGTIWTSMVNYTTSIPTITAETINLAAYTPTATTQIRFTGTSNYGRSVILDDVLVEAAPACTPATVDSSTVADDCGSSQFTIDVVVSVVGDATVINDGTATYPVIAGTVVAGPYASGTSVTLTVEHTDSDCDTSLGSFTYACPAAEDVCMMAVPITVGTGGICGPTAVANNTGATDSDTDTPAPPAASCGGYGGGDIWFSLVVPASGAVTISGSASAACCSFLWYEVYEGADCGSLASIACSVSTGNDPSAFETLLSGRTPGETLWVRAWDSFNDNGPGDFNMCAYEPACTPAVATYSVVSNCATTGDFNIDVDVTNLGSAASIDIADDQASPVQTVTAVGTYSFGPYVNATDVVISLTPNDNAICNQTSGTLTQEACPPANNDCSGAESMIPSTTGAEVWVMGTTLGYTASGETPLPSCSTFGTGKDLWYSVEVPASGEITVETRSVTGSALTDTAMSIYSGTCGAFTEIECDDDDSLDGNFSLIALTGQTPASILYIRVFEWNNNTRVSSRAAGDFEIAAHAADPALTITDFDSGSAFTYYPNPVNDNLSLNAQKDIQNVSVYNLLGQEVLRTAPNAVNTEVNMSALQSGAYFVKVTIGNATETVRVIKN